MKLQLICTLLSFSLCLHSQNIDNLNHTKQLLFNDKYVEALSILNLHIDKSPTDYEALTLRASCQRLIGNYDIAFVDIANAIKLNKNYPKAYTEYGKLCIMKENYQLAMVNFNKAIELDSLEQQAYASRGTLYAFYLKGDSMGLIDLNKAVLLDSTDESSRYNRGILYNDKENYEAALNDLNFCLRKKPNDHLALNARGNCYYNMKKYNEAITDYLKAVKYNTGTNPHEFLNTGDIYNSIGDCYLNLNKKAKANKYYRKAIPYGV
ncbi:MAG: tetratricopeptide repeat protein [Bacteroidia bacterium]|nr:tetratricopeptide repeat protein [Bacteroidia bacterium]